jgi:putative copper resistance protein D
MLTLTVVAGRMAQFAGAMVLFGSPLFFVYGLPGQGPGAAKIQRWPRPLLSGAAILLALASIVSFCAQTAVMSGSITDALKPDALASVLTDTQFGFGTAARLGLAILAGLILAVAKPSRALWLATSALGAGGVASFAWTGHGASDEGMAGGIHLASDVLHLLAAAVWLGALTALSVLLLRLKSADSNGERATLHRALEGFSGIGSAIVAVLLATGLANSWFLIGPAHLTALFRTTYGLLLTAKVALFGVMLGLAAANRFQLTPRLGRALAAEPQGRGAVAALRRSVLLETSIAVLVLVVVSVLGTFAPPSAQ